MKQLGSSLTGLLVLVFITGRVIGGESDGSKEQKSSAAAGGQVRPIISMEQHIPGPAEEGPYVGVAVSYASDTLTDQLKLPKGVGLVVDFVDPEGPAKGKIETHDVLNKLNDQILVEPRQFAVLIRTYKPDDKVSLTLIHQGETKIIEIQLRRRPLPPLGEPQPGMPSVNIAPFDPNQMREMMMREMEMKRNEQAARLGQEIEKIRQKMEEATKGATDEQAESMRKAMQEQIDRLEEARKNIQDRSPELEIRSSIGTGRAGNAEARSVTTFQDGDFSYTFTSAGNITMLQILDRDGKPAYTGDVNSKKDVETIPDQFRGKVEEWLKSLDAPRLQLNPMPNSGNPTM